MLNERSPGSANRVVTLTNRTNNEEGGVAEQRGTVRTSASRATLYLAHVSSLSQEIPPEPERPEKSIWSSVFNFFVEGFANCAAPLCPSVAYLNAGGHVIDGDIPRSEVSAANGRRVTLSLVPNAAPMVADGNRVTNSPAMAAVAPSLREADRPNRRNWLTSCREAVVAFLAYMRRGRGTREAVDALATLDDRARK